MIQLRILSILVFVLLLCQSSSALSFKHNKLFDNDIKKAVKRYWTDFPKWRYWKAQLYQESLFNKNAVSPVGAEGLAQFMPKTKKQIWQELGFSQLISAKSSYHSIVAGAYYMRKLRNGWSWNRPPIEKNKLAQASYNAGMGNILKAQRLCDNALLWDDIKECLPQVTGHHSKETITYVERIRRWYLQF